MMFKDYRSAERHAEIQIREAPDERRFIYFNRNSKRFQLFSEECGDSHLVFVEEVKVYA